MNVFLFLDHSMSWFLQIIIIIILFVLVGVIPTMLLRRNIRGNPRAKKERYIAIIFTIIWLISVCLIISSIFLEKQIWPNFLFNTSIIFIKIKGIF